MPMSSDVSGIPSAGAPLPLCSFSPGAWSTNCGPTRVGWHTERTKGESGGSMKWVPGMAAETRTCPPPGAELWVFCLSLSRTRGRGREPGLHLPPPPHSTFSCPKRPFQSDTHRNAISCPSPGRWRSLRGRREGECITRFWRAQPSVAAVTPAFLPC